MDINSLLSPQDTPISESATPEAITQSPRKHVNRERSGSLRQSNVASPFAHSTYQASSLPQHILNPIHKTPVSSPKSSPTGGVLGVTPPPSETALTRGSSTPNMDTLANLASMQNHQPARSTAPVLRSKESYESQLSPSTIFPTVQTVPVTSNARSSFEMNMIESSKRTLRTDFSDTSLPLELQQKARLFSSHLQGNPYAYESHVEIIKLLHQGFVDHVYPPASPDAHGDPQSYDLLDDLRMSRQNMDKIFAIGEGLWVDWIQDESMLARTVDERIEVMEKCLKAVEEEYGSAKLWVIYGDWVLYCYNSVQESQQASDSNVLSEDDKMIGREAFTWQLVLDIWRQGADNTAWRINDSHLVWDRYIDLVMQDLKSSSSRDLVAAVNTLFDERLRIPHANWVETFQIYSTFVSTYLNKSYEDIMVAATQTAPEVKASFSSREAMEISLQRAQDSGDRTGEYTAFSQYLEWERAPAKRKSSSFDLTNALYQRAVLRFPSDPKLWEDHTMFIIDEAYSGRTSASPLATLDRATRHCPWSGSLWSQYLLSSEREGQSFTQTEEIKHKATNTGLLDVGGIDEVLKIHIAWCSYLRRRAFRIESSDEDLDVAEMGIRSSIENLQELSNKKYGEGSNPDPLFRLERIYIKYLTESGSWDSAREAFRGLIPKQGDSWEFWLRFYVWEMMCWAKFIQGGKGATDGPSRKTTTPHYATAILKEALRRPNLDWPEKIMQALITHCEDHEEVEELQLAVVEVKKMEKILAKRRVDQATEAAITAATVESQAQNVKHEQMERAEAVANGLHIGKRKREDDLDAIREGEPTKKARPEDLDSSTPENPTSTEKQVKRDRENATILVQNLPDNMTEVRVRQLFRDCGTVNSLKLMNHNGLSAVIEFDEKEAALFAQSRDQKDIDDFTISVQMGSGSTLFVANFPPTADETFIRNLFEEYGEIIDIRFPSLKYNTHRRFCYVQFMLNAHAQAATKLNGKIIGDDLKLVAKLSDPVHKQDRSGAMEEGREVYAKNVHWAASEDDIASFFSKFGNVESVRIPRNVQGKSKGFAFVVFSSQDEANAALAMSGQDFKSRTLHVEKSSKGGAKRQATTVISQVVRSNSPSVAANGTASSPSETSPSSGVGVVHAVGDRNSRTISVMNLPDTVNDSRIRSLAEENGKLVKIVLRPDHQGVILEYSDASDAGKASLAFEGYEIVPGRRLRVGSVPEMLREKAEIKVDKIQVGKAKKEPKIQNGSVGLQSAGPIKRPGQQGGRRGGLGQKKGLGFPRSTRSDGSTADDGTLGGGKSNDDFRAMLG